MTGLIPDHGCMYKHFIMELSARSVSNLVTMLLNCLFKSGFGFSSCLLARRTTNFALSSSVNVDKEGHPLVGSSEFEVNTSLLSSIIFTLSKVVESS